MRQISIQNLSLDFDDALIKEWLLSICRVYGVDVKRLSYLFVNDKEILQINRKFLQHDYFTDVITFDYTERENQISGEVYISTETVRSNAETLKTIYKDELCRVIAHGLLHLIGFRDKTPEEQSIMRREEEKCLLLRPKNLRV